MRRAARTLIALVVAAAAVSCATQPAAAGSYVVAAGTAAGCADNSWTYSTEGAADVNAFDLCPTIAGTHPSAIDTALEMSTTPGATAPYETGASATFNAPAGTSIVQLVMKLDAYASHEQGWAGGIEAIGGSYGSSWAYVSGLNNSSGGSSDSFGNATIAQTYSIGGATAIQSAIACYFAAGCTRTDPGHMIPHWADDWAYMNISSVQVTLKETATPTTTYTGGGLTDGSYHTGTQSIGYSSSDTSGIQMAQLVVDGNTGQPAASSSFSCDYTKPVPCQNQAGTFNLDETKLADGPHTAQVWAENAAGNWAPGQTETFYVSNTAPAAPKFVYASGNGAWQGQNSWTVGWQNPTNDLAPETTVHYETCPLIGQTCATGSETVPGQAPGQDNTWTGSFGATSPGQYTLILWEQDQAGNSSSQNTSSPVALAWDTGAPGLAQIAQATGTNGWLDGAEATAYTPQVSMAPGAAVPASGVAGYAVTTDGTTPGTTITNPTAGGGQTATLAPPGGGWPEGTDTIEARAISGAGVASSSVATITFKVDRTPPTTNAYGYGNPAPAWQPAPVDVTLQASDALSGMGASDDETVTDGGYIAYTLDAGAQQTIAGGLGTVRVASQGQHWISYRAYDVAGNVSQSKTVYVNVGTASQGSAPHDGFWSETASTANFSAAGGFGAACPAQATLTPSHDTYVDQAQPSESFGTSSALVVRSSQNANARALLDFSLPAADGCSVTSAELRLYSTAGTAGRTLEAFQAGSPWTDTSVTWNTRPGTTGSGTSTTTTTSGWQTIDVTTQIQDIYSYGDDGLIVRDASEGAPSAAGQSFTSSKGDAAQEPQLVVSFG